MLGINSPGLKTRVPYIPHSGTHTVVLPKLLGLDFVNPVPAWDSEMKLIKPSKKTNKYILQYAKLVKKNFPGGDDTAEDMYKKYIKDNCLIAILVPKKNVIKLYSNDSVLAGCEITSIEDTHYINNICSSTDKLGYALTLIGRLKDKYNKLSLEVYEYDENIIKCGDWKRLIEYYSCLKFKHKECKFPVEELRYRKVNHLKRVHIMSWER